MNSNNVQPSIWYYGLAVLIIFIGFAAFAGSIYYGISDAGSGLMQIVAPASVDLNLSEPGEYIIFYENNSYINGKFYSTGDQIPGLEIRVREKATGLDLATYPAKGSFTYSLDNRNGRSILAFTAPRAGIYQVNASYSGSAGPEVVLAIGKGVIEGMLSSFIISMAALFGSIAIAAVISYVTYIRRKKALLKFEEEERIMRGVH
jgi:ABC-type antimicrobial peptide transport system permease subunit